MQWLKRLRHHSWRLAGVSISGILVTIIVAGLIALAVNERMWGILVQTIEHDLDLEDHADELWTAVVDIRYYHSNLALGGPTPRRVENFESAYQRLLSRISQLKQIELATTTQLHSDALRQLAQRYYSQFQPAIKLYTANWPAFEAASDNALTILAQLEDRVRSVERLGERNTGAARQDIEAAAATARLILTAKLIGHMLIGGGLAYLIILILREQHRASAELALSLRRKNDFIADISHELRTPLTVLRANAEVALDLERNCVHTELLEEIVQASSHMTRLVEDLLFLTRSEAGAMPFVWEVVRLGPLLNKIVERADSLASQHTLVVRFDLAAEITVRVDQERLTQAVLILIDNAAKYSAGGTPITLRSALLHNEALIEVEDQGVGIPAEDLPLIFERFYRADKARIRKPGGAGLGLAIAKSIISAHGGRITAESVVNQGTKMRLYLPLAATPQTIPPEQTGWLEAARLEIT